MEESISFYINNKLQSLDPDHENLFILNGCPFRSDKSEGKYSFLYQ